MVTCSALWPCLWPQQSSGVWCSWAQNCCFMAGLWGAYLLTRKGHSSMQTNTLSTSIPIVLEFCKWGSVLHKRHSEAWLIPAKLICIILKIWHLIKRKQLETTSDICFLFQLSFIQHSLINPDIFCFADYPCHTVATDILKAPPEDDNREIATW